jgi:hypothetical protein
MAGECPNTHLRRLTANGPWYLLHSPADMHALIVLMIGAAAGQHGLGIGTVAGDCPPREKPPIKGRRDPMLEACRAAGEAAQSAGEASTLDDYVQTAVDTALEQGDLFTLRWFTFMVMFMCDGVIDMLSASTPAPVVDRFFTSFKADMCKHVFGHSSRSKSHAPSVSEYVISTPLEIVATFMIHLQASYFTLKP